MRFTEILMRLGEEKPCGLESEKHDGGVKALGQTKFSEELL